MHRTTVLLPLDLKRRAEEYAAREQVSLGEVIRSALNAMLANDRPADDPLFANYVAFSGNTPDDVAQNHDEYLYGPDA